MGKSVQDYLDRQNDNFYPKILIPQAIQKALIAKPELKETERFSDFSFFMGALGVVSLFTPVGWIGMIGAGAAILYDATEGYKERDVETQKENEKAKEILSNPTLLQNYMKSNLAETLSSNKPKLAISDARLGKYDNTLLMALRDIPNCVVKSGEGLNLGYTFTPDVIIHVPSLNLWIDIEVDEPWFVDELGQKQPIHYIGKDRYRDERFLQSNWVVFRFAEEQVAKQVESCTKEVADFLQLFDVNTSSKFRSITTIKKIRCWTYEQALDVLRY
jgi:hypothetical protein